jgi:hypothetical protein
MSQPLSYAEYEGAVALVHAYLATGPAEARYAFMMVGAIAFCRLPIVRPGLSSR